MSANQAALLREHAVHAARIGDLRRAGELFEQAVAAAPRDVSILNSAGSYWSRCGDKNRAIELYEQAVAADPSAVEPLLNVAIMLTGAGKANRALELLKPQEMTLAASARYWSVRANAERALGAKQEAFRSYDRAAKLDPANPRAAQGRARLALETGLDAREHYRTAVSVTRAAPTAVIGLGQALEAAGEVGEATAIAERLVAQLPGWVDALEWLAELRWAAGEVDHFATHYRAAAEHAASPEVYASWCRMLAGVDRFTEAADVAAQARTALGDAPQFALLEAVHAGEAGDDRRAEQIFAGLPLQGAERWSQEARHRLRTGEPERAEALTAAATAEAPEHTAAWALRDIAWRLLANPRHQWLHGQAGLVRPMQLHLDNRQLASAVDVLDRLHDRSNMPVGQSVRNGSQTRGRLFDRSEPEIAVIKQAFEEAVEEYRRQLPSADESHPLLRRRDVAWHFAGSWSIRAFAGGRHTEHIHPQGLVSSAAYFAVPVAEAQSDPQAGWLELGRPPPDLRLELPPLFAIDPRPGWCVLFPSTLYHGTRRFSHGKRLTVAIDINRAAAQ